MSATDTRAVVQQLVRALESAAWWFAEAKLPARASDEIEEALPMGRALLAALPEQPAAPQGDSVVGVGLPLDTIRTGWPEGMLQDDDRNLSRWLANTPDARRHAREAAQLGAVSVPAETASGATGQDQPKQPLTDEQIDAMWSDAKKYSGGIGAVRRTFARAIERAHGITGGSSNE